jgi:hypothetical protein
MVYDFENRKPFSDFVLIPKLDRYELRSPPIEEKLEIGNLSRLEELNVANNFFSCAIPIEIKQCSSLRRLHFEGNHFVGPIPDFLGAMRGL